MENTLKIELKDILIQLDILFESAKDTQKKVLQIKKNIADLSNSNKINLSDNNSLP